MSLQDNFVPIQEGPLQNESWEDFFEGIDDCFVNKVVWRLVIQIVSLPGPESDLEILHVEAKNGHDFSASAKLWGSWLQKQGKAVHISDNPIYMHSQSCG